MLAASEVLPSLNFSVASSLTSICWNLSQDPQFIFRDKAPAFCINEEEKENINGQTALLLFLL